VRSPGCTLPGTRVSVQVDERGGMGSQVAKSCLPGISPFFVGSLYSSFCIYFSEVITLGLVMFS
jgi:hypothetical protein